MLNCNRRLANAGTGRATSRLIARVILLSGFVMVVGTQTFGQVTPLGPVQAHALSKDGNFVVGVDPSTGAIRLDRRTLTILVLDPSGTAHGLSSDGSVIVGEVPYGLVYNPLEDTFLLGPGLAWSEVGQHEDVDGNNIPADTLTLINPLEDINGNGAIDPGVPPGGDFDGLDNDGNGVIDDVAVWTCFSSDSVDLSLYQSAVQQYVGMLSTFTHKAAGWSATSGSLPELGAPKGYPVTSLIAVSDGGLVLVGNAKVPDVFCPNCSQACRWTYNGTRWVPEALSDLVCGLPSTCGDCPPLGYHSSATSASPTGNFIVGSAGEAFVWTPGTGMIVLGGLPVAPVVSTARAVSADEQVIVGEAVNGSDEFRACRWTYDSGTTTWTIDELESLLGPTGASFADAVSGDGSVIVGFSSTTAGGYADGYCPWFWGGQCYVGPVEAFIWDEVHGMRSLQSVAVTEWGLGSPLAGWQLVGAIDISRDGRTILCDAINPSGNWESVVIKLGNTPPGTNVPIELDGGAGTAGGITITFDDVTIGGQTTVTDSESGPTPPTGFTLGALPTYYDISTSATFTGAIELCINYSGSTYGNENSLKLFHYESGAWLDVTTSLDTVSNVICGQVTSLSPFVIVEPCAAIEIHAARHTVGSGASPSSSKAPLAGITVGVYDAANGNCARQQDQQGDGISWQEYPAIVVNCSPVQTGLTDGNGVATIAVPDGDYIVISHFDSDGDGSLDQYIGVSAGGVQCGQTTTKHL